MILRSLLLLLLALSSARAAEQTVALVRKGNDALAAGLWEMAALHFTDCLGREDLSAADKPLIALRLAEAWIHQGKTREALDLLDSLPDTARQQATFWKGQAQLGQGRFREAVETMAPLLTDPKATHHAEAGFTVASLQLSLGQPGAALDTLAALTNTGDTALNARAAIRQVEIMLDLGRPAEAREIMPDAQAIPASDKPLAAFLDAHLLLAGDQPEEAAAAFQSLIDNPEGQSARRYHAAALGLADSLHAAGNTGEAETFLLGFINDHPASPQLSSLFSRVLAWLPAKPAPNDPVLARLAQWIPPPVIPATGLINTLPASSVAAWPAFPPTNDLPAFATYTRATGLRNIGTPETNAEARRLLTRLRLENPTHFLADRALFETARWDLDDGSTNRAFNTLATLRENATSPTLRGEASFEEARGAFQQGDRALAIQLFDEAAASLAQHEARAAKLNAAILRLSESPEALKAPLQTEPSGDPQLNAELKLERALSLTRPGESRAAIELFLLDHPEHPRAAEARLAAARVALNAPNPDLSFARAQLETLAANPGETTRIPALQIELVRLRIQDLAGENEAAIQTARSILETFPNQPASAKAAFVLGRSLFQTRNYNEARMVLEKLATADIDSQRAQAALLLAARSAALVPTSQSQQEALLLFDKVISRQGPLAAAAMIEKSRLMIDMNRLTEAAAFLREWFDSLPPTDPLHLPAGLLLGEAIYAQGSVNPDSLTEALAVYDQLLLHTGEFPSVFNRIQYLRGRTLEQIPDPENPALTREKQAFIAYYSVLETDQAPAEWTHFELCGFRALALLENAGRWPAAIACAKKIASFKGPRAEEAATRASQLQLKHMIWED